jgi:hypothetical protein
VWAVGFDFLDDDARVLHYDGTEWAIVPGFESDGSATFGLYAVWGSSATDVYAVNRSGEIWHYNGSSWVKYAHTNRALLSVWGSGRLDVWAAGTDNLFGDNIIYHGTR